jgi:hypothetical protein
MKLLKNQYGILLVVYLLLLVIPISAQDKTVGVITYTEDAYEGYTLFTPQFNKFVYLINNDGELIHTWEVENTIAVREAHLLDNGNLIVIATPKDKIDISLIPSAFLPDGSIREYTWDGELVWEYQFLSAEVHQHHGLDIMPNGNILVLAWDYHTLDEALDVGLNTKFVDTEFAETKYILPDIIIEIDRSTSKIVWQWDPWDHLVQNFDSDLANYSEPSEYPNRIDINYQSYFIKGKPSTSSAGAGDWMHSNTINYNPDLDQVAISVRSFDEFWIIDHSLSTEETMGSEGDLLYRWGNPFAYGQGDQIEDRQLFGQHDIQWIDSGLPGEGNMLIFNNQVDIGTDDEHSAVLELSTPAQPDGTYDWDQDTEIVWSYDDNGLFSFIVSGVQRLPNGNTFITEGFHGRLMEVTPDGEVAWEFVNPITKNGVISQGESPNPEGIPIVERNFLFRVRKYSVDFPGFEGRDMTPGARLID